MTTKTARIIAIIGLILFPTISLASLDNNLKYGAKGDDVIELQEFLISKGFLNSEATGNFFTLTRNAVTAYQNSVGLPTTGFVGPLTREKINLEVGVSDSLSIDAERTETGTTTSLIVPPSKQDAIIQALIQQISQLQNNYNALSQIQTNQVAQTQQLQQIVVQTANPVISQSVTPVYDIKIIKRETPTQYQYYLVGTKDGIPSGENSFYGKGTYSDGSSISLSSGNISQGQGCEDWCSELFPEGHGTYFSFGLSKGPNLPKTATFQTEKFYKSIDLP